MGKEKAKQDDLFEDSRTRPLNPRLIGMARIAASGESAGSGHLVEFRTLAVRSLMNNSASKRGVWFAKSINPYRGCEFGCKYCYARYTHEFMEMKDPVEFERKIYIKQNAAWLLEQELRSLRSDEEIALGTATDPWQPIERRARVTRSLLEVMARRPGLRLGVVTKSTLIERDIDLLTQIAGQSSLTVCITITTTDTELARKLEPRAPRPDLRFETVERLRHAGLRAGVLCSPLMPGITDSLSTVDAVCRRAREADASFFGAEPLFLKPCSRGTFFAFVHEHFPELDAAYARRYQKEAFVPNVYRKRVRDMVAAIKCKYGYAHTTGSTEERLAHLRAGGAGAQQELWPTMP